MITAGGLSVIAAVLGICIYLVYVTVPLLSPGRAEVLYRGASTTDEPAGALVDEYLHTYAFVTRDGRVRHREVSNGDEIGELTSPFGSNARVLSFDADGGAVIASSDAGLEWAELSFRYDIRPAGESRQSGEVLEDGRVRVTSIDFVSRGAIADARGIRLADLIEDQRRTLIAAVDDAGRLRMWSIRRSRSLVGGASSSTPEVIDTASIEAFPDAAAVRLLAEGRCLVIGADGSFAHLSIGRSAADLVERGSLFDGSASISAVASVIGRRTVIVGTADGRLGTWWVGADRQESGGAGRLVAGPPLHAIDAGITAIAPSLRDRTVLVGDASGGIRFVHASSGKTIARISAAEPVRLLAAGPKLDGFLALAGGQILAGSLEVGHPDVTTRSLFGGMLYEGQTEPMYVYQASGASDAAEPKLSLVPLIFGTLKATLVSMFFAAPVAILAAIYSSEFLAPRVRRVIKPLIETMASLPSVVLGFVAAMVVAPFVADHLGVVLVGVVLVPTAVIVASGMAGAYAKSKREAHGSSLLPLYVSGAAVAGVVLSIWMAGPLERSLFGPSRAEVLALAGSVQAQGPAGQPLPVEPADAATAERVDRLSAEFARPTVGVKSWLGSVYGSAAPGWALLLVPGLAMAFGVLVWPVLLRVSPGVLDSRWEPLLRVAASGVAGALFGSVLAIGLTQIGIDARDSVLGVFTQRNTFVIGIVMGFAIIPIIYTISDDALQSVPANLRAASFGAGATRWQTTVRVVLPVAASGIFSATMIGLGRAVGETMIVLMATGNTPIMDWNIFEGLRTLSANIAVELPEAERGGTHYRLLFLCGVVLFIMTFVVNTTAEIVRQRFRKRNALL